MGKQKEYTFVDTFVQVERSPEERQRRLDVVYKLYFDMILKDFEEYLEDMDRDKDE
ncbi:hypothetical protein [Halobacillus sp. A5]|uniref:hypothetical protein n=1 Tax=Halobacillus sp. A5 TaxID=2880263 RepID=UPI0020A64229|nr:hypothetical protein [Halobacillus sp. A5]MCP3026020.1 hypothetical protein [Halobacillus sp. A5]